MSAPNVPHDPHPVLGPCPCDECPSAARCKALLMCCATFVEFIDDRGRWRVGVPRRPSRRRYVHVYDDAAVDDSLDDERTHVAEIVAAAGSVPRAAALLGMSCATLYKRMQRWGIARPVAP